MSASEKPSETGPQVVETSEEALSRLTSKLAWLRQKLATSQIKVGDLKKRLKEQSALVKASGSSKSGDKADSEALVAAKADLDRLRKRLPALKSTNEKLAKQLENHPGKGNAEALAAAKADLARLRERLPAQKAANQKLSKDLALSQERSEKLAHMVARGRIEKRQFMADLKAARLDAVGKTLPDLLAHGKSLAEAAISYTEAMLASGQRVEARAFAHSLTSQPETAQIGTICSAIHAKRDGFDDYSWQLFNEAGFDACVRLAPSAFVGSWLLHSRVEAEAFITERLGDMSHFAPAVWWEIAQQAGGLGAFDLLRSITSRLVEVNPDLSGLSESQAQELRWTHGRALEIPSAGAAPTVAADRISLGIIDYKMLDRTRTSSNVGDYVQTLAYLSNLLRHQNVDYGDSRLGQKLESLKARIKPNRRLDSHRVKVTPIEVDRDFTSGKAYPDPTWTIAFGWHAHPNFSRHFDYPFAEGIKPIFVSFHVNNVAMLNPATCDYLRRYEPIGCRDWTTVYILRERGISAFFSGCMTTTIGQIFNRRPPKVRPEVALVDHRAKPDDFPGLTPVDYKQVFDGVREMDMVSGLDAAEELLQGYRAYSAIATSRLHCYLPCTSIGLDVKFHPKRRSDVRFEGLLDLDAKAFQAIRSGIETKVEAILNLILGGASEEEVYAGWRAICAEDVAFAERYVQNVPPLPAPSFDVAKVVNGIRKVRKTYNGAPSKSDDLSEQTIEVAFALDDNLKDHLPVVIESMMAHVSRPVRANILSRGLPASYFSALAKDFPALKIRSFACDDVDYGENLRMLKHTTVSTMDRLLLPDLLNDVDRLIYLDIDILVLGDLAELWDRDLQGHGIGGKSSTFPAWKYGHNMVYRAADTLDADKAWDLRRRMHAGGRLDFQAFNAGVLLMDLDKMRQDQSAESTIPLIEQYGMNDQDALNVYARENRIELGRVWNAVPSQDYTADAKILHFAGPVKPWDNFYVLRKDDFERYRIMLENRRTANTARPKAAGKRSSKGAPIGG